MADFDAMGELMWKLSRMRELQRKAEKLRGWESADLLALEQELDKTIGDYFAEQLMPNPEKKPAGDKP